MSEEAIRRVIIAVVLTVLILRTPSMVRDREQRPLWLMLVVFAGGSIVIQSWFGEAINKATGISQFNNLVQGVWGILNVAVTLEFVTRLAQSATDTRRRLAWRTAAACVTAAAMALFFALTPASERFKPPHGASAFTAYALSAAVYMIGASTIATWILWRHLSHVRGKTLYLALLMLTIGNATQVPFMAIRTVQRLTPYATPGLLQTAFLLNTTRFILVPLGCAVVAVEPLRKSVAYYYRRARIAALWYLLRSATKEIALTPPVSRRRDLLLVDDTWERLHRRVIEIRDSIFYLYDTWVWPDLVDQATRYAQTTAAPQRHRTVTIACWLEAARRAALIESPKQHHRDLDKAMLPDLLADQSTVHTETRYLLQLHRAMRSRVVRNFVDQMALAGPGSEGASVRA
jgi:hypothetical protein